MLPLSETFRSSNYPNHSGEFGEHLLPLLCQDEEGRCELYRPSSTMMHRGRERTFRPPVVNRLLTFPTRFMAEVSPRLRYSSRLSFAFAQIGSEVLPVSSPLPRTGHTHPDSHRGDPQVSLRRAGIFHNVRAAKRADLCFAMNHVVDEARITRERGEASSRGRREESKTASNGTTPNHEVFAPLPKT